MEVQSNTTSNDEKTLVVQPSIFKEVKYWEVNYRDLEELINKEFGLSDFSFVASEECGNDTQHRQEAEIVTDPFWLERHKEDLEEIRKGDWVYKMGTIMNELAMRGKIAVGQYLINVSW